MKLSFCITCKNRLHQVSQTLYKNLEDNRKLEGQIEFVLVDFGSSDGLKDWVLENFPKELASGYLKFFFTTELPKWECPKAKNTAHMYAEGDILVNLDCDNFTGTSGASFVLEQFSKYGEKLVLHQSSGIPQDGSFGRISLKKKYFFQVGGYDESFDPMGFQDTDLVRRLKCLGLHYIPMGMPNFNKAIMNDKNESILFTNSDRTYFEMNNINRKLSKAHIIEGKIKANDGPIGISKNVYKCLDGKMQQIN